MNNTIKALLEERVSANWFDAARSLNQQQIEELVRLATLAPTAFNYQNWKFIAVQSKDAKERLKAVSYGQQKVVDAADLYRLRQNAGAQRTSPFNRAKRRGRNY